MSGQDNERLIRERHALQNETATVSAQTPAVAYPSMRISAMPRLPKPTFPNPIRNSVVLVAMLLAASIAGAHADSNSRTLYGPDGRVIARESTDTQGTSTTYGADGKVIAARPTPASARRSMTARAVA
jgi:YD repeat-containing protein